MSPLNTTKPASGLPRYLYFALLFYCLLLLDLRHNTTFNLSEAYLSCIRKHDSSSVFQC